MTQTDNELRRIADALEAIAYHLQRQYTPVYDPQEELNAEVYEQNKKDNVEG